LAKRHFSAILSARKASRKLSSAEHRFSVDTARVTHTTHIRTRKGSNQKRKQSAFSDEFFVTIRLAFLDSSMAAKRPPHRNLGKILLRLTWKVVQRPALTNVHSVLRKWHALAALERN